MYCKNCGSILASNSNFCHVCGAKVEIDDLFDVPKVESNNLFGEEKEEKPEIKEEPKEYQDSFINATSTESSNDSNNSNFENQNNGYYGYSATPEEQQRLQKKIAQRRAVLPGIFGMAGSAFLMLEAGSFWALNVLALNYKYNDGAITWDEYQENAISLLTTTGAYMILSAILGITLGIVGIMVSNKAKNVKGKVFAIVATVLGGLSVALAVVVFIYRIIFQGV